MELISIREAARRIGVSDTALHKAIKAGRLTLADPDKKLLAWPQAREDFERNTDASRRTHAGPVSDKPAKKPVAPPPQTLAQMTEAPATAPAPAPVVPAPAPAPATPPAVAMGPSLAQSRALREAYLARLAKLEYEQKSGLLVPADEVKVRWFKRIKAAQTRILGIPASCKARAADLPLHVVAIIDAVCREALEDLANDRD